MNTSSNLYCLYGPPSEASDIIIIGTFLALARTWRLKQTTCCVKNPNSGLFSVVVIFSCQEWLVTLHLSCITLCTSVGKWWHMLLSQSPLGEPKDFSLGTQANSCLFFSLTNSCLFSSLTNSCLFSSHTNSCLFSFLFIILIHLHQIQTKKILGRQL